MQAATVAQEHSWRECSDWGHTTHRHNHDDNYHDHHYYNYHDQLVVTTLVEPIKQMAETKMAGGLITKVIIMVILIEILNRILKIMILSL